MNNRTAGLGITLGVLAFMASLLFFTGNPDNNPAYALEPDSGSETARHQTKASIAETFGKSPLRFEANDGQVDGEVQFLSHGKGYSLRLSPTGATYTVRKRVKTEGADRQIGETLPRQPGHPRHRTRSNGFEVRTSAIDMGFVGANPAPQMVGEDKLVTTTNYQVGNDPAKWQIGVANYAKVRYVDIYPGIDLIYHGNQRQVEYDFIVQPGVDPDVIHLAFTGMEAMSVEAGNLVLQTPYGAVIQQAPIVYQEVDGQRIEVAGTYALLGDNQVGFALGDYDAGKPLIIDPVLTWTRYYTGGAFPAPFDVSPWTDGTGYEEFDDIALDAAGNAYVVGWMDADGDFFGLAQDQDVLVVKLDTNGAVIWQTITGGSGRDQANGIEVDGAGNTYITGNTRQGFIPPSTVVPLDWPNQDATEGGLTGQQAYVVKLDSAGANIYSKIFSHSPGPTSGQNIGYDIALGAAGKIYVSGTSGNDAPFDWDAFVARLDDDGSGAAATLDWLTDFGGQQISGANNNNAFEDGWAVAVDSTGRTYVAGWTNADDFPGTIASVNGDPDLNNEDAFLARFDTSGAIDKAWYLGGTNPSSAEVAWGVAIDSADNVYVTGHTRSSDFASDLKTPPSVAHSGSDEWFLVSMNALDVFTQVQFIGGAGGERAYGIAVDASDDIYVMGLAGTLDFPIAGSSTSGDAVVAKFDTSASFPVPFPVLEDAIRVGGTGQDQAGFGGLAVDATGGAFVPGATSSTDLQGALNADPDTTLTDAFVAKIQFESDDPPGPGEEVTYQTVVLIGDPAPGGETFTGNFHDPVINNKGSFAFGADTSEGGCGGIYRSVSGALAKVLCEEGLPQETKVLMESDNLAFSAVGPQIYTDLGGLHSVVGGASSSNPVLVPGFEKELFELLGQPRLNDDGLISFWGLTDGSGKTGIWQDIEGTLGKLVAEGDEAPVLSGSAAFTAIGQNNLVISNNADTGFVATTDDSPGTGVWSVDKSTAIRKVIAPGDPAPGSVGLFVSAGDLDNNPSHVPSINRRGEVALRGTTDNAGESGVWVERWNETTLSLDLHNVILAGTVVDPITGWTPTTFDTVAVNDIGNVAFRGCSAAPNACGIVLATWDESAAAYGYNIIALEVLAAGAAPDPLGASFVQINAANLVLNAASQVAFQARAATQDNSGGVMGIWGWDPETGLHRVILTGDNFEIAKGDIRTIADSSLGNGAFSTTGGGDGRPSVLNDQKQLVFTAFFEEATPLSEAVIIATIPGALPHEILITSGPTTDVQPVLSGQNAGWDVAAEDSFGHDLSYIWTVDCSGWSDDDGTFILPPTEPGTSWAAPINQTGEDHFCFATVTIDDGEGLSKVVGFGQLVRAEGKLEVTSEADFLSFGTEGGPFFPSTQNYLIRNAGKLPIDVRVEHQIDWLSISTGGFSYTTTLEPGESESVNILLNNLAKQLSPGGVFGFINFTNQTNGDGDTQRRVALSVLAADGHGIIFTELPSATPNPALPNEKVQLDLAAIDTRGHPLHYSWSTQNCSATFDDYNRRTPVWSYSRPNDGCEVVVDIGDGLGGLQAEARTIVEVLPHTRKIAVTPEDVINFVGPVGGPFFPDRLTYFVENVGTILARVEYNFSGSWIWDPFSRDEIEPGEYKKRDFAINEHGRSLPAGSYTGTLEFKYGTSATPPVNRIINLTVNNVTDCTAPSVTAPSDLDLEATDKFSDIDLDPNNEATASDPQDVVLTPSPVFAGPYPVGFHTIRWGVVNSCGNVGSDTQTLTIQDTTPPMFTTLPVDIAVEADGPRTYIDLGTVEAEDLVDPSVTISNDAPANNEFEPGTYVVTWMARDDRGYEATAQQTVTIRQTVKLIAMEAVQISQDLDNSVPLIEGKSTLVRAYFEPGGLAKSISFNPILTVTSNGQSQLFLPDNYGGYSATSTWWPFREEGSSANYLLPRALTHGAAEFRIDVFENGFDLKCDEAVGSATDDCRLLVDFEPAPAPFELTLLQISYTRCDGIFCFGGVKVPTTQDVHNQLKRIYAQFPINSILWDIRPFDLGDIQFIDPNDPNEEDEETVNSDVSQLRKDDGCTNDNNCERFYYSVVLSDGLFGAGGRAYRPGRVSWGRVANNDSSARFVSGQEIGHNLGLQHTLATLTPGEEDFGIGPCNAPISTDAEPFFPYISEVSGILRSTLGPLDASAVGWVYGWDSDRDRVISPFDHFDTMSYCGRMWPSSFTYARWRDTIFAIFPPALPAVVTASLSSGSTLSSQLNVGPHLLVRGTIAHDTHAVSFEPFLAIDSAGVGDDVPGDHLLLALDAFGEILHEISFEPANLEVAPTEPGVPHPTGNRHFSLAVPFDPDLFEIKIIEDGIVLGAITASQSAPTVDVVFPNGGELLAGDTVKVEWDAQDADSDPLTFNVQFSPDNGTSWIALAVDHEETFLDVGLGLLPGTNNGIIRVVASDGFWSVSDTSDFVFSTPNTPPMMVLLSPNPHQVYSEGQTVVFKALSQDVEDGSLAPENIEWFSDQATDPLGTGPDLDLSAVVKLPAGDYQITVVGTDSDGDTGEDSVHIIVLGGAAPPVFIAHVATSPSRLWPPNKKMVPVTVTPEAMVSPVLDPPDCEIIDVASNEPDDDKKNDKFKGDWSITGPLTVDLRAERSRGGTGREYAITVACSTTDLDGLVKVASETGVVTVPTKDK